MKTNRTPEWAARGRSAALPNRWVPQAVAERLATMVALACGIGALAAAASEPSTNDLAGALAFRLKF